MIVIITNKSMKQNTVAANALTRATKAPPFSLAGRNDLTIAVKNSVHASLIIIKSENAAA